VARRAACLTAASQGFNGAATDQSCPFGKAAQGGLNQDFFWARRRRTEVPLPLPKTVSLCGFPIRLHGSTVVLKPGTGQAAAALETAGRAH
jgi:hypothetical protein